ncbi:T1SS-143 domain-containing protein [Novosphingobium kunmingense]|uniref:T1SS-143 domain-containing protein n=1 Tax=Novosphingobium kunmingense TaxID=1211806 RepID=A0A2N0H769_9SPHN|nr:DUF5801 repeats-in-toxin domain-containing protein [Novosphingobium kunmingense]PKB14783.1 T1SS-143 domain-containing protein [Novosphingobium kunmingense]
MDFEGTRNTETETALDSAALAQALPELAVAAAAVARSGATALVPDANNTVVLPEGASLDDITVRGRDLIIQTDDGRVYIIVDGAVFVPQVIAQGVTVPPLNLAALLIGNEPEPAAGPVRSSGGNFAVPVGSIQDAYKIGDLLPYTELRFPEPQDREIFPAPDAEPETGPNPDVLLDDDALTGGNPGGAGDDADNANTSGILSASGGSGALTWTLSTAGAPSGFSYVANGDGVDVFQGAVKVLAITLNPATGAYSVAQLAPIVHPSAEGENNQLFTLTYSVTDIDGDTASGTLGINVDDDSPVAGPDTDTIAAGTFGPATGNILTDAAAGDSGDGDNGRDSVGADGGLVITAISGFGGAGSVTGLTTGQYGKLTLDAAGNYSYIRNPGTPGGVTDTFTYTIRDADGDTATTTLTITIADAAPQTGANAAVLLDDDAFPGGNAGGTGDDADSANTTGTLAASGGDGTLTWALSAAGAPAGFSYAANGTGIDVFQGSTKVLAVTLNTATGGYTVTQLAPIVHAAGSDENNAAFTIGYTVTDIDGDPATGSLTINVDDDTPVVTATGRAPALVVDETDFGVNASRDLSTLFTHAFGADGAAASGSIGYALGVVAGPSGLVDTLTGLPVVLAMNGAVVEGRTTGGLLVFTATVDANGVVTLDQSRAVVHTPNAGPDDIAALAANLVTLTKTVTDRDGDSASATAGIGGLLQFVDDAPAAANDTDALLAGAMGPATGNVLTDAEGDGGKDSPNADGGSVTAVTGANGAGTIGGTTTGQHGTLTLGANGEYSYVRTTSGPIDATDTFTYTLTDGDGDAVTATLTITLRDAGPMTGENATVLLDDDALAGGNAGGTGDDVNAANTSGSLAGSGGDGALTWALTGATVPAGFTTSVVNPGLVEISQNGTLVLTVTLNAATGAYSVTQNAAIDHPAGAGENNLPFTLAYTVTDADGDSAAGSLGINVDDDTPLAANDTDAVVLGNDETSGNVLTGVGGDGNPAGADSIGADGAAQGGAVTAVSGFGGAGTIGGTTTGQHGTLTLGANGEYSYVRTTSGPIDAIDTFTYTLTDGDGDAVTATLTITLRDAGPMTGENATVLLDDDALAGGNAGGTGDDVNAANTSGSLAGSGGDGALTWALTGATVPAGFTTSVVNPGLVEISQNGTLVLTVTLNAATGAYSVTQNAAIDHPAGAGENNLPFTLAYTVTDADGDSAAGSLGINVDDDTPLAANDTDAVVLGNDETSGNVLTGVGGDGNPAGADSIGADGAAQGGAVTAVSGANGAGTIDGSTQGLYGTLKLNADGSYTYTRASGAPGNSEDIFTYTITDADGDTATATLIITIEDARPFTEPNPPVQLDDDAKTGGNPGGVGDVDPDTANTSGTLSGAGGDGALTWAFGTLIAPAGFTVTQVNSGLIEVAQGNTLVMTITLNSATGAYTVTQVAAIDHAAGGAENDLSFTLGYTVTDSDGDSAPGSIVINIDDDTPTVTAAGTAPNLSVDETNFTPNSTADLSTLFSHSFGADGAAASDSEGYALGVVAGPSGLVDTLSGQPVVLSMNGSVVEGRTTGGLLVFTVSVDGSGNVTLDQSRAVVHDPNLGANDVETIAADLVTLTKTVTDGDGDSASATAGIGDHLRFVDDGPSAGGNAVATLNDDLLSGGNAGGTGDTGAASNVGGTLSHSFGNDGGSIAFLTTGAPATFQYVASGSNILVQQNQGGSFVTVVTVTLNSATGAYTVSQNAPILHPTSGATEESSSFTLNYVVTDGDGDTAPSTLVIVVNDDTPTAVNDIDSVTEDGALVADGNVFTGVGGSDANGTDGAKDSIGADGAALGGAVTAISFGVTAGTLGAPLQGTYGSLTIDAQGNYSYALDNGNILVQSLDDGETRTDEFTYTITDRDGDTTTAKLTITINGANDAPVVTPSTTAVSEEGLPLGNQDTTGNTDTTNSATSGGQIVATDVDGETLTFTLGQPQPGLTSGGVPIIWTGVGTSTLTGTAGGIPVITVTIDGNGNYTVTLLDAIDQPDATVEDSIGLTIPVNVSDGTTSTGTTIVVSIEDDSPVPVEFASTSGAVDEDGLGGGIAGGTGDIAGEATVATGSVAGLFKGGADTAPQYLLTTVTGLPSLTSGGVAVVYSLNTTTNVLTATAGGNPVFTLAIDKNTGAWTFTLQGPVDQASGNAENNLVLDFAAIVQAVDVDGDRASVAGTFQVTINDDTPTALNDSKVQTAENQPVTIDVFTNDLGGADGKVLASVTLVAGSLTNGGNPATGSLVNHGDGTFTYAPGPGEEGTITFQYTITDKDGDVSQATATITLLADSVPNPIDVGAAVDDDGLNGGNPGSTTGDIDANSNDLDGALSSEASFRGQINMSFGNDTGTVSFANLNGTLGTIGTETVSYSWNAATFTLTATVTGGVRSGTDLFTVKLTPAGEYTVTLLDNVIHAAGLNETSTSTALNYRAADSDGDSSTAGRLVILFNDDAPTATASATQPTLTVDETVLATNASASFASVFTPNFGADGAAVGGGAAYTLGVVAGASGLVDTLSGQNVNLVMNGNVVEGRTATSNLLVFTVSVDGSGNVTLDQIRAVVHTPNNGPNDTASLSADTLVTLTGTFTDADGDVATATANIGQNLVFTDDAPTLAIGPTDPVISRTATGDFTLNIGADARAASALVDSYVNVVLSSGSVNGQPITVTSIGELTPTTNTSSLVTYAFAFTYDRDPVAAGYQTATNGGTISLNTQTGDYTVTLDSAVATSLTVQTNAGSVIRTTFDNEDNPGVSSGPEVTVAQLLPNFFVQFSGEHSNLESGFTYSGGSNGTFSAPESYVTISGSSNGVASDTIAQNDVLELNFFTQNPGGDLSSPTEPKAMADAMFLQIDQFGNTEDMVVVLKLVDPANPNTIITRTFVADNSDFYTKATGSPAGYSFTFDNDDAVLVIESNDYRLPGDPAVYQIVGMQVVTSTQLTSGLAYDLNGAVGTNGGIVDLSPNAFADGGVTDDNDVTKIVNIGFILTQSNPQPLTLNFTVEATDADGDSTGAVPLTVTFPASVMPIAVDLDGGGVQYLSTADGVAFDYNGDGAAEQTAWVAAGDGLLAIDANGSGTVDAGSEIVFGGNGLTDLQGVAATYDSNGDGLLDTQDAAYAQFGVWQDANSNGVSEAGEFKTLAELGIASLDLTSDGKADAAAGGDVTIFGTTTYTRADGTTGIATDVAFATTTANTLQRQAQPAELAAMSAAATALLAAMAMDHANAAAAPGVEKAATHGADLPAAPAAAAADLPAQAAPSAFAQFAAHAADKVAAADGATGSADRGTTGQDHASLGTLADRGADKADAPADAGKSALFGGNDGHAAMDALLAVAAPAAAKGTATLPGVTDALADAAGNHAVDSIVDHFAAHSGVELGAMSKAGDFALQGLLDSSVQGSGYDAGAAHFAPLPALDHEQAAALA